MVTLSSGSADLSLHHGAVWGHFYSACVDLKCKKVRLSGRERSSPVKYTHATQKIGVGGEDYTQKMKKVVFEVFDGIQYQKKRGESSFTVFVFHHVPEATDVNGHFEKPDDQGIYTLGKWFDTWLTYHSPHLPNAVYSKIAEPALKVLFQRYGIQVTPGVPQNLAIYMDNGARCRSLSQIDTTEQCPIQPYVLTWSSSASFGRLSDDAPTTSKLIKLLKGLKSLKDVKKPCGAAIGQVVKRGNHFAARSGA